MRGVLWRSGVHDKGQGNAKGCREGRLPVVGKQPREAKRLTGERGLTALKSQTLTVKDRHVRLYAALSTLPSSVETQTRLCLSYRPWALIVIIAAAFSGQATSHLFRAPLGSGLP